MSTRSAPRLEALLELCIAAGHLSIRIAKMEPDTRYRIDVRDESHPVVYLNARDYTVRELAAVFPEIEARLVDWRADRKRRALTALPDEGLVTDGEQAATGTDGGVGEFAARVARVSFGVLPGGLTG